MHKLTQMRNKSITTESSEFTELGFDFFILEVYEFILFNNFFSISNAETAWFLDTEEKSSKKSVSEISASK